MESASDYTESQVDSETEVCRVFARLGVCFERGNCDYWHPSAEELSKLLFKEGPSGDEEEKLAKEFMANSEVMLQSEEEIKTASGGMSTYSAAFVPHKKAQPQEETKFNTEASAFVPKKKKGKLISSLLQFAIMKHRALSSLTNSYTSQNEVARGN